MCHINESCGDILRILPSSLAFMPEGLWPKAGSQMTGKVCFYLCFSRFGGSTLCWPGGWWALASNPIPLSSAPFLLSPRCGGGLSPAALDIWSVSARRPPPQKPLLSSAPCVSTFLWTNTALNNSVCSASTCPGTAVQTRLPGWDVWYPNPGLKKEPRRAQDQLTTVFFWKTLIDYFDIFFGCFLFPGRSFSPIDFFFHSADYL